MNEVEIGRNNKLYMYKKSRVCCYDELASKKYQTPTLSNGRSSNR